jgi:hypothetical protein
MSPRNAPCAASATTIGGAPYALNVRNCSAGIRIGESCIDNIQQIRFDSLSTGTVRKTWAQMSKLKYVSIAVIHGPQFNYWQLTQRICLYDRSMILLF